MMRKIRAIDMFCGAGGCSWGARSAGISIVAGFDLWNLAGQVYEDNFPEAKFYCADLKNVRPTNLKDSLGKIDLILASPECTNHSLAKGKEKRSDRKRSEKSRETVLHVLRFARVLKPRWILIENVTRFRKWRRYHDVIRKLRAMGYFVREQVLDASHFGVPQARKRLYLLCDNQGLPDIVKPPQDTERLTARSVISLNGTYGVTSLKTPNRAQATLQRAQRAIHELGPAKPFLLVYYGTDKGGGLAES